LCRTERCSVVRRSSECRDQSRSDRVDNVIPRALFDKEGRERYPTCSELVGELEDHALWKLGSSDVVIGLSSVVGDALDRAKNARLEAGDRAGPTLMRLEHPSFMVRRPVHERTDYVQRLDVVFQEVVHLVRTEEAEVAKLQCSTERPDEQP